MSAKFELYSPLQWVETSPGRHIAETPFANYRVSFEGSKWRWSWCFVEYHDEDTGKKESREEAMAHCQADWDTRMESLLPTIVRRRAA